MKLTEWKCVGFVSRRQRARWRGNLPASNSSNCSNWGKARRNLLEYIDSKSVVRTADNPSRLLISPEQGKRHHGR